MSLSLDAPTLDKMWPHAAPELRAGMVSTSEAVFEKYAIVELADLVDFMAQVSEESGGGIATVEDLNYSAERLCQVWPKRFPSLEIAAPFASNPRALANSVYGGRNGNVAGSNDGWAFRGRGLIQLTGRELYGEIAKATGLDLIAHPAIINSPLHALECAAAYWQMRGISALAAAGNFKQETRRINGGYTNMAARRAWQAKWHNALTLTEDMHPSGFLVGSKGWAQSQLLAAGCDPQGVDGFWGDDSRAALHSFEIAKGLPVDGGDLSPATIDALKLVA